jgi:hypothetical protein
MPQAEGRSRPWRDHRQVVEGVVSVVAAGRVDWSMSVDSSIVRAHQHPATAKRVVREDRARLEEHTEGLG